MKEAISIRFPFLRIFTLLLALPSPTPFGAHLGFQVEGVLITKGYSPKGDLFQNKRDLFSVVVDSAGNWEITTRLDEMDDKVQVVGSNGRDVFGIFYDKILLSQQGKVLESNRNRSISSHVATVTSGSYPINYTWYVTIPWFAYTSSPYLLERTDSKCPAIWLDGRIEARAHCFEVVVDHLENDPRLPKTAEFYFRRSLLRDHGQEVELMLFDNEEGNRFLAEKIDYAKSLPDKYCEARYTIKAMTNIGSLSLPSEFELQVYFPPQGQTKEDTLNYLVIGKTTSIQARDASVSLPVISGVASTYDQRLRFGTERYATDGVKYFITNATWIIDTNAPLLKGLFERERYQQRYSYRSTLGIRRIFMLLLIALCALPAIYYLKSRAVKKNTTTNPKYADRR